MKWKLKRMGNMNIAIIGLGVIGGSIAKALSTTKEMTIYGIDINESTLQQAIFEKTIDPSTSQLLDILPNSDVVFICLLPHQIPSYIEKYSAYFKEDAILVDVSSIKGVLVDKILPVLPSNVDFIFTHPMRGSEKTGYESSSQDLFIGANIIVTPTSKNKNENIEKIELLYETMGAKKAIHLSPSEHDRQVAYVSHLPHAIAVALMNSSIENDNIRKVTGSSFKDITRIADINSELWTDIFMDNNTYLIENIEKFEKELSKIKTALQNKETDQLKKHFHRSSSKYKNNFNG